MLPMQHVWAIQASQNFLVCSISVPSMASKNLLVTAGNMARDHEMRITFLGMHAAAAGLALQERRWFHISKASASRLIFRPFGKVPACQYALSRLGNAVTGAALMPCDLRMTRRKALLSDAINLCREHLHRRLCMQMERGHGLPALMESSPFIAAKLMQTLLALMQAAKV